MVGNRAAADVAAYLYPDALEFLCLYELEFLLLDALTTVGKLPQVVAGALALASVVRLDKETVQVAEARVAKAIARAKDRGHDRDRDPTL